MRLEKGFPLTPLEVDNNFRIIRDFSNGLESLFYVSFNTDGTLKDGAVDREAVLVDRVVTQRKLSFTSSFFAVAGGAANAFTAAFIPPISGGYVQGMVFFIKANHSITGAATLNIDGQGAVSIRKTYNANLVSGDIVNNQVFTVVYESSGPYFQLVNTLPFMGGFGLTGLGGSLQLLRTNSAATAAEWFTAAFVSTPVAFAAVGTAQVVAHPLGVHPSSVRPVIKCVTPEFGYAALEEVNVSELQGNGDNAFAAVSCTNANATVTYRGDQAMQTRRKDAPIGTLVTLTYANWQLKVYFAAFLN